MATTRRAATPDPHVSGGLAVVEIEVLDGLRPFAIDEVAEVAPDASLLGDSASVDGATAIRTVVERSSLANLLALRCAVAVHLVVTLDVVRPRSMLSPDQLATIASAVEEARALHPRKAFASFRFSAAGAASDEFERLHAAVAASTGLVRDDVDGDALLRFRKSRVLASGWDVLIRLTPRPLSARPWRVFAFPGSLNATVAAAMVRASNPSAGDRFVDPMCGSGTLLVERLAVGRPARVVGADSDAAAVNGVAANLRAARYRGRVERVVSDARRLPHPDGSFDVVCTNLPWGTSVGSHDDNRVLYPAVLRELRRVVTAAGRAVVLTHEVSVFEDALGGNWDLVARHRIFQKGHHPRMYVLRPR